MSEYDLTGWPLFRSIIEQNGSAGSDNDKTKRCYVLSAVGANDPEAHKHVKSVVDYIIRPALLDTDYAVVIGQAPDADLKKAFKQGLNSVMNHDLVIAVLSHSDELLDIQFDAAQAVDRPRVVLTPRGQVVGPYNIEGERVVDYALTLDEVLGAKSVLRLRAAVHEIEKQAAAAATAPVQPAAPRQTAFALPENSGNVALHERAHDFTDEKRLAFVQQAEGRIDVLGIASMSIANLAGAAEVLRGRAQSPLTVRLIQVSPRNPALPGLLGGQQAEIIPRVRKEIDSATRAWMLLEQQAQGGIVLEIRRLVDCAPTCSALVTDKHATWTPYLSSRETSESPTLESEVGSPHYHVVSHEFNYLWERAKPLKKFAANPKAANDQNIRQNGPMAATTRSRPPAAE